MADDFEDRLQRFVPVELTGALGSLTASERRALDTLIEASRRMDPIFDRQVDLHYPELRAAIAANASSAADARVAYFDLMRGPWDRQEEDRAFALGRPKPLGAGFYPEGLDASEFRGWLEAHPDARDPFESPFTRIVRRGADLAAEPYAEAYREWLDPAAALLERAATETENASLCRFLRSRAAAFRSNDYYESDKDWMDLDGPLEITIGPYETYEDRLFGLKAAFEAFVTVADPDASAALARYKAMLPDMEAHLPIPEDVKTKRGAESPIRVVDLVFASGDARKSVQTMAFNLPNDERVRAEKGAKKVLLRNVIQAKFDVILRPIAERILDRSQQALVSRDAFFQETLFHELSHSLGPAYANVDGRRVEARVALESTYAALEECKADAMGAYNVLFMIERGDFPTSFRDELLVSYVVGLFRSIRFGIGEAHGLGAAVQLNRFAKESAIRFAPGAPTFAVDCDRLERSIATLVRDICLLQHRGDLAGARAMLSTFGVLSEPLQRAVSALEGIAIDLRPTYPAAGE